MTAADELVNCSLISATAVVFSAFGMLPPLLCSQAGLSGIRDEKRPGAGRTGRASGSHRSVQPARAAPALRRRSVACAHATTSGLRVDRHPAYGAAHPLAKSALRQGGVRVAG